MIARIVGIDLAAQAPKTGLCVLDVSTDAVSVTALRLGATDADLLDASVGSAKIGVDAPLGWPDDFRLFLDAQRSEDLDTLMRFEGKAGMDRLSYRETDRDIHAKLRKPPLSVAADKIARVAMRCAVLQARWVQSLGPIPRDGSGPVVEVYPAAALLRWYPRGASYRHPENGRARRIELLGLIRGEAPWLRLSDQQADLAIKHDDALDALVSALVALAAHRELTEGPPASLREQANREGWIHVPSTPLAALAPPAFA